MPPTTTADASHRFHPMQVFAGAGPAAYTNLSCYFFSQVANAAITGFDWLLAQYNATSRQSATAYDGVRVAVFGGVAEHGDTLTGAPTHESYSPADLTNMGASYRYQQQPLTSTAPYAQVNSLLFLQQEVAGEEESLDSQAVYLTSPTSSISMLPSSDDEDFLSYFERVLSLPPSQRPHILSTSFILGTESDSVLGAGYVQAADSVMMQAGLMGLTILAASGDDGANGVLNRACTAPPPARSGQSATTTFVPEWPASSPFVLSVGATDFSYGFNVTTVSGYYQSTANSTNTVPRFCGRCSDYPGTTVHCQSSYIAEQAVNVADLSTNPVSAGSGHTQRLRHPR